MPRQKRQLWTRAEDDELKHFKTENPNLPWGEIIKLANLQGRDGKSCSERWNNHLKSDFNKEKFSPQEDETIIILKSLGESWASMAENSLIERRSHNAIKNRWNNHLVKRPQSDHSVPEDKIKAWMAEFQPNDDLNAISSDDKTSDHYVRGDDLEASTSGSTDLIDNPDPNALHWETYTR